MLLKITTAMPLDIGGPNVSNLIGSVKEHLTITEDGGLAGPIDLRWWYDQAAYDADKKRVFPMSNGALLDAGHITLTPAEAAAEALPLTIYNKAADYIEATFPGVSVDVIV